MLKWLSIIALLFQAAPSAAGQDGVADSDEILRLDEWSVEADKAGAKLTVRVTNVGQRPFRMIDAAVIFTDMLGEGVGTIKLYHALEAAPGEQISYSDALRGSGRLLNMRPASVCTSVQVKAVLYADGSLRRFNFDTA